MSEYISKFTGEEIDTRLTKVETLENYDDLEIKNQLSDLAVSVSSKASSGELNEHISDTEIHVTSELRQSIASKADKKSFESHAGNEQIHFTTTEKAQLTSDVEGIKQELININMEVGSKASQSALAGHINARDMHTTAVEKENWNSSSVRSSLAISTLGYERKNLLKNELTTQRFRGIQYTVNSDGSVTMNGTVTDGISWRNLCSFQFKAGILYRLTGGLSKETRISLLDDAGSEIALTVDSGSGAEFSFDNDVTMNIRLRAGQTGAVLENETVYPMLRYAEISDDSYEPYKPSVEERLAALEAKISGGEI